MGQGIMLYLSAITLGAFHAFEPGHGKTVIAAYMLGTKGRAWDGVLLGLIVTFTHTFSVIILAIAAKVLAKNFSEAELHTWLGLVSSILILCVGIWMFKSRLSGKSGHSHFHLFAKKGHSHHHHVRDRDHQHDHHEPAHDTEHHYQHHNDGQGNSCADQPETAGNGKWSLLLLGISGGLVPCPAGIAILLTAVGAGQIAKGLTMALFFSLGLGLVMMAIGITLSRAGKLTEKISDNQNLVWGMGMLSSVIIIILGGYILIHSLQGIL